MSDPLIVVQHLSKSYRVVERGVGLRSALSSLLKRSYRTVEAVQDISFSIEAGEIVGFLGPNGAGKTTTLKILAGLLHPTAGDVRVAGFVPWKRDYAYLREISMVLGNKSQILWDLPPRESFHILAEIYRIPYSDRQDRLNELVDLLEIGELIGKPARNLSLGERMKCELLAALLHRPAVLFLDEPTLGLDITMQRRLRQFIAEYNQRTGATIILTSHYMADVEALCPRVIVINEGRLLYDGGLQKLAQQFAPGKLLHLTLSDDNIDVDLSALNGVKLIAHEGASWTMHISQADVSSTVYKILQTLSVLDLTVEDPPIESVIDQVYQGGLYELV